ncbi:MAG: GNAT family N-acetyltransferase [Acidimicrobiales bacterium]|nr:GNAT family N-acetyltransferase [Acidimicrobiales bacterium]
MGLALPEPPLSDGSIALRPWRDGDEKALAEAWADPEIRRWTAVPSRRSRNVAWRWIRGEEARRASGAALDLVIVPQAAAGILGEVGLSHVDLVERCARIGYWVTAPARRHGVATRAVRLLAGWALGPGLGLDRLELEADARNVASVRVAERCGFLRTGERRLRATPAGPVELDVWERQSPA